MTAWDHGDLRAASPHATVGDGRLIGVAGCVGKFASALDQRHRLRRSAVALRQQPLSNRAHRRWSMHGAVIEPT
ncbi:hypothetical protein AC801_01530 [Xanthomonas sp. ISO98C4]|nr:hypothetical protein AC801_01530 [Xanthomonas sp. ISO98C4]QWN26417.1 hypothetical protein DGM93_20940 [Xanthomonas phaseoli pv. phaseoli]QWN30611.1 hypothetical protein DGM85_21175 [Xanthomonas phaseoli pv. phaseoli]QWN34736.1 hypothetical protein DGM81_20700 [Xanthomonas phaseoli pv. phaseoli]